MNEFRAALHKANPVSQLLAGIPGVGSVEAITLALTAEPGNFASGRHVAAWLGLDTEGTFHRRHAAHGQDQQGWQ